MRVIPLLLAALLSLASPALTGHDWSQMPIPLVARDPLTLPICRFETQNTDPTQAVSTAGALGFCQIKPDSAKAAGFVGKNSDLLTLPHVSVMVADEIVERCRGRYWSVDLLKWSPAYRTAYCYYAGPRGKFNRLRRGRDYAKEIAEEAAYRHLEAQR